MNPFVASASTSADVITTCLRKNGTLHGCIALLALRAREQRTHADEREGAEPMWKLCGFKLQVKTQSVWDGMANGGSSKRRNQGEPKTHAEEGIE